MSNYFLGSCLIKSKRLFTPV